MSTFDETTATKTTSKARLPRRLGPIIVGILFLFAACGISIDFFVKQYSGESENERQVDQKPKTLEASQHPPVPRSDSSTESGRAVASSLDRDSSTLPFSSDWPEGPETPRRKRGIASDSSSDSIYDPVPMAQPKDPIVPEISIEPPPEDLKISLAPSAWKGAAQLLPNPMYVRQLEEKRGLDIRGGGWVAIDIAKSQIIAVELFKAPARRDGDRRVIEAKRADGREVMSSKNTGFPIVRGVRGLQPGGFTVFENPPCLVRFSGVGEEEICEMTLGSSKIRYKFAPPELAPEAPRPDFVMSSVYVDIGRAGWKKIVSYNESFHPIGDANRDGFPDFYVESVTGYDNSGFHTLLISRETNDVVGYEAFPARFRGSR